MCSLGIFHTVYFFRFLSHRDVFEILTSGLECMYATVLFAKANSEKISEGKKAHGKNIAGKNVHRKKYMTEIKNTEKSTSSLCQVKSF